MWMDSKDPVQIAQQIIPVHIDPHNIFSHGMVQFIHSS